MYLKEIELIGFKSFATRTLLKFEKGLTAIVGPNGCGKSNVADAIRWVIGEQSAKSLRAGKMEDVIFSGTDTQKPLGMAEVSLTLMDCEEVLGTEFNEMRITRRVFRSGEGQYFINKGPCRLKDIQRLFMDTGIGTSSYSLMEQGKIDLILSSRPDDRRRVFEEASGITKYLADKKEAIRKLEHTEDNLLRLEDIVREVKRQIGSLQRQAGKARRYKALQEKLRSFDIYVSRHRLNELDKNIGELETRITACSEEYEKIREAAEKTETSAASAREELGVTDLEIERSMDAASKARHESENARQIIAVNKERISDIKTHTNRDTQHVKDAQDNLEKLQQRQQEIEKEFSLAQEEEKKAQESFDKTLQVSLNIENRMAELRNTLNELRQQSMQYENKIAKLEHEFSEEEKRDKAGVLRRERLAVEQDETQRIVNHYGTQISEKEKRLQLTEKEITQKQNDLDALKSQRNEKAKAVQTLQEKFNALEHIRVAKQAQLEMLGNEENQADFFPGGAKMLLQDLQEAGFDRSYILGTLAEKLEVDLDYRIALESCLRNWVDAVVLQDKKQLLSTLHILQQKQEGAARLLCADMMAPSPVPQNGQPGVPLLEKLEFPETFRNMAERLLNKVMVVDALQDIPDDLAGRTYVTKSGTIVRDDGSAEFWSDKEMSFNPLAQKHQKQELERELDENLKKLSATKEHLTQLQKDDTSFTHSLNQSLNQLETMRQETAKEKGEYQLLCRQAEQARERLDTVSYEFNSLLENATATNKHHSQLSKEIEETKTQLQETRVSLHDCTEQQREQESERTYSNNDVEEQRLLLHDKSTRVQTLDIQRAPLKERILELRTLVQERELDISGYHEKIDELEKQILTAENSISPLAEQEKEQLEKLKSLRNSRKKKMEDVDHAEVELHELREKMDALRTQKSTWDVEYAEEKVRHQNILDRLSATYQLNADQVKEEPKPKWEQDEPLPLEEVETSVAEIRTKLESMGPINMTALTELKELEKRYQFLLQQQSDLVNAKENLLGMIQKINATTTEMFTTTFNQVNENFQDLFKRLFGHGSSAKLILVNEEEVLESGIEIIARPPGKTLQNISLLSGGERTMTAVGLLFALYMVKHSPFCVLDELDAALDDANIGRFVEVVNSFVKDSQFIVITHNQRTISAADILYGITMPQKGISEIVSVKLQDYKKKNETE